MEKLGGLQSGQYEAIAHCYDTIGLSTMNVNRSWVAEIITLKMNTVWLLYLRVRIRSSFVMM